MVILYHCYHDSHINVSLSCRGGRLVCVRAISFLIQGQFWFSLPKYPSFDISSRSGYSWDVPIPVTSFSVCILRISHFLAWFSLCVNGWEKGSTHQEQEERDYCWHMLPYPQWWLLPKPLEMITIHSGGDWSSQHKWSMKTVQGNAFDPECLSKSKVHPLSLFSPDNTRSCYVVRLS